MSPHRAAPAPAELAALTGVRSGKRSYYSAYRRSDERLGRAVQAMDDISRALVRTGDGPLALLERVARAAAEHLSADWALVALVDGRLPHAGARWLAVGPGGEPVSQPRGLPPDVARELGVLRAGVNAPSDHRTWVRVPLVLDALPVGGLLVRHGSGVEPEPEDLSVLRILAGQAAVSLHASAQYQSGLALRRKAEQLYDEASRRAEELAARDAALRDAEQQLQAASQRELLDAERHRIARELHDSVTQCVLAAGMQLEVLRADLAADAGTSPLAERVVPAKELTALAVEQLRSAIYALTRPGGADAGGGLPEMLEQLVAQHRPALAVGLRLEGRPVALPEEAVQSLARLAGEALFNVAVHAGASRAAVLLRYRDDRLSLRVSDDGRGDPLELRRMLRLESAGGADGRHRGLANMSSRAAELGGSFALRRSRLGGIRVEVDVPLPLGGAA